MIEKFLGKVEGIFNYVTLIDMGISLVYVIMGLVFYFLPDMSNLIASILTGLVLILSGANQIYSFIKRDKIHLFNNNLIYGIILVVVGILAMFLGNVLSIVLGIYFIVSGAQKVNYGIVFRKFKESSWLLTIVIGVLFLILGIVCFFAKGDGIVSAVGLGLIGYGLINLVDVILLRKRCKNFLK